MNNMNNMNNTENLERAVDALKMDNSLMGFDPDTGEQRSIRSRSHLHQCVHEANLLAITALEKQIAKKVGNDIDIGEDHNGNLYKRNLPICPSCKSVFLMLQQPYCSGCGQKLDWRDWDDE